MLLRVGVGPRPQRHVEERVAEEHLPGDALREFEDLFLDVSEEGCWSLDSTYRQPCSSTWHRVVATLRGALTVGRLTDGHGHRAHNLGSDQIIATVHPISVRHV